MSPTSKKDCLTQICGKGKNQQSGLKLGSLSNGFQHHLRCEFCKSYLQDSIKDSKTWNKLNANSRSLVPRLREVTRCCLYRLNIWDGEEEARWSTHCPTSNPLCGWAGICEWVSILIPTESQISVNSSTSIHIKTWTLTTILLKVAFRSQMSSTASSFTCKCVELNSQEGIRSRRSLFFLPGCNR